MFIVAKTINSSYCSLCIATNRAELDDYLQLDDFTNGSNARYQYEINTEEGITIRLCVEAGRVIVYASFTIPNPNSALNHFTLDAIFHNLNCQDVYIDPGEVSSIDPGSDRRKKRQDSTVEQFLFVSVEGIASSSRFTLETTTGNTTQSMSKLFLKEVSNQKKSKAFFLLKNDA